MSNIRHYGYFKALTTSSKYIYIIYIHKLYNYVLYDMNLLVDQRMYIDPSETLIFKLILYLFKVLASQWPLWKETRRFVSSSYSCPLNNQSHHYHLKSIDPVCHKQALHLFKVWKSLVSFTFNPDSISINPSRESSWLSTEWLRIHGYISSRTKLLFPNKSIFLHFLNTFYIHGQILKAGVRTKEKILRPHQQCMSAGKWSFP